MRARPRRRIGGGFTAAVTTRYMAPSPRGREHGGVCFGWRRSRRPLAPFAVAHTTGWSAVVLAFWGERVRSSERAQLAVANGVGRQGLLRRESERSSAEWESECYQNASGLLRRESEWCRKVKTEMRNNNAHLRCEKKGNSRWQSKETCLKKWPYPIGSPSKETRPNKHASLVWKLSVTDLKAGYRYSSD
jgi:hypothetical protein